jgi:hypothetical protein
MNDAQTRENYRQLFQRRIEQLKNFARKHRIAFRMYCTDPEHEEGV